MAWIGSKIRVLLVIGVLAAAALVPAATSAGAAPTVITLTPAADAYVDANHATSKYGTKSDLKADLSPQLRTYLRFNVQGVAGTVTKATLRLFSRKATTVGFEVRDVADDSWSETTITHATAPPPSATVTSTSGPYGSNVYASADVTALVQGNGLASFAVTNPNTNEVKFSTRERGAKETPQLIVEYEPTPTPPTNTSPPTISGQANTGRTLTGNQGTWTGTPPISYANAWLRCDGATGNTCNAIPGAMSTTYVVTAADETFRIRFRVTATNGQGSSTATSAATAVVTASPPASPVIAAAGDISCPSSVATATTCRQRATSDLLVNQGLAAVLPLGDIQYENGELTNFNAYYDPTWGRVKSITYPVPGNHEYNSGATGYYAYFSSRTSSPGYYSYDIGAWHLIALNSNCGSVGVGGCGVGSAQYTWLQNDLATHSNACTLAYWHHPRFNSGAEHGNDTAVAPFWDLLYAANADVVLVGHEHLYERFGPQTPAAVADSVRGIRQFTVGTGGKSHYGFGATKANSQVRSADTFGVLKLTLDPTSYSWQFVPEAGKTFTDTGTSSCH